MRKRRGSKGKIITFEGKSMNIVQWAEYLGINRHTLDYRLKHWPLELALTGEQHRGLNHVPGARLAWLEQAGMTTTPTGGASNTSSAS